MLYVDGKSKLANVLVILQANSYTEKETVYPAQVLRRAKEESHMQSTNIRQTVVGTRWTLLNALEHPLDSPCGFGSGPD